ncbi:MAG: hypothetical protein IJL14_01640 [Selenomonadaceae bacterium]|nr:hypothetical protein [Selenomonadaceae bacterium]
MRQVIRKVRANSEQLNSAVTIEIARKSIEPIYMQSEIKNKARVRQIVDFREYALGQKKCRQTATGLSSGTIKLMSSD